MNANTYDLVIFDCDGVLVDSEILSTKAYENVFKQAGVPLKPGQLARLFGLKQNIIMDILGKEIGRRLPDSYEAEIWPELKKLFNNELEPTNGVTLFLENLKTPRCVASSSTMERIKFSLDLTDLRQFFADNLFSSSMVERGKPAPDLFLLAAETMGVKPERCIVIEDSPFGVEGARAAGMTAIGYMGGSHEIPDHEAKLKDAGVTYMCRNWEEMTDLFVNTLD